MNSELLSFSVLAAILGMGVVFVFLGILSVFMAVINRVFGDQPAENQSAGDPKHDGRPGSGNKPDQGADGSIHAEQGVVPRWVIAAAVAFLMEEDLDFQRSAAAWQPSSGRESDGWHFLPRV